MNEHDLPLDETVPPIILGLCGRAGTGKTVTSRELVPYSNFGMSVDGINWAHLFFALPIYRAATARQKIEGEHADDRILYELHDFVLDLFGRSPLYSPIKSYADLVDLVHHIASLPCEPDGEKPRAFMQELGALCREYDQDVFVRWMQRKSQELQRLFHQEDIRGIPGIIISDVRYLNEAQMVHESSRGFLVRLVAKDDVLQERILKRDGKLLTLEQLNHQSEQEMNTIPIEWFDLILDTSSLAIDEQAQIIQRSVAERYSLVHA